MSEIKVSVLCTAYNHEKYIGEALESFVSQEADFHYEILVTDDASTDSTPEIIRSYAEQYPEKIRYFHQEKNLFSQGINIYKEILFPNARGKYISICEGDDYFTDPKKLAKQVSFLEEHPDYSGCVHNSTYHFCDGKREDELLLPMQGSRDVEFSTIIKGMNHAFHTSSILTKKELFLDPPDFYDTAFSFGFTDYAIALWMVMNGKIRFIDEPMSVYRVSSNSDAWSSGVGRNYGKLTGFVKGEIAMMETLLLHLSGREAELTKDEKLRREYELLYLEGKVGEMVRGPYRKLYRAEPLSFKIKTGIKRAFPGLHEKYRKNKGYSD